MKTIGLIGGMSWESSLDYYRLLNEMVKERLGGFHSAKCVLYSVDFQEIEDLQHKGGWDLLTGIMIEAARKVARAGADFLLICTNTMHKMAAEVEQSINIPLLHIADTAAMEINKMNLKKVALLGTKFTMEQDFYKARLSENHGIGVIIPQKEERQIIHEIIYNELVKGQIKESSRKNFVGIMDKLVDRGAEGILLGCTEIPLLVGQHDTDVPVFDTTRIHAAAAVEVALQM